MKKLFATIIIALAAMFVFCSYCEAKKHKTIVASAYSRFSSLPTDFPYERIEDECDSLIQVAINRVDENCVFKAGTEILSSRYYVVKRTDKETVFVECYNIPIYDESYWWMCDRWTSVDDFYQYIYQSDDDEYVSSLFTLIKQRKMKI